MALPNAVNGGSVTSSPSGSILVIHAPAPTVSGWQDYYITEANFLQSVTDDITQINLDIAALESRVNAVEDLGTIDQTVKDLTTSTSKSFYANSMIEWVAYHVKGTGNPTLKMGSNSPDFDNIIPELLISDISSTGEGILIINKYTNYSSSVNYTITVSGGRMDLSFKIIKNILI